MSDHFLIFVPGILGSELRYVGESAVKDYENVAVWGEDLSVLWDALAKNPACLRRPLQPGRILRTIKFHWLSVKKLYDPFLKFLAKQGYSEDTNFHGFAYDWRQDNRQTALLLANFMRGKVSKGIQHFKIVAHSMGGIVVRLLLADPSNQDLAARVKLFVQIGTPVLGSSKAYYTLKHSPEISWLFDIWRTAREQLDRTLLTELIESVRSFDSIFQLLPAETENVLLTAGGDHFSAVNARAWPSQYAQKVRAAQEVHQIIQAFQFPQMKTFYGTEIVTDYDYVVDRDFNVLSKRPSPFKGDGTVIMASAVLASPVATRTPIPDRHAVHDSLPNHKDVMQYLASELPK